MVPCFLSSVSPRWFVPITLPADRARRRPTGVFQQWSVSGGRTETEVDALLVPEEWRRPGPQSRCRSSIAKQQHDCECSRKCVNKCYRHERPLRVHNVMCDAITGRGPDKGGNQPGN